MDLADTVCTIQYINIDDNEELQEANLLEEIILNKERKQKVQNIMNKMSQEYQLVIYLTQVEELSYRETAAIMEKKESQIKKLSYNARKKLRQLFIDEKLVEVRNNKIIKLLMLFIVFGVITTSVVFAKDIKRIIDKIFFGGSAGMNSAINNDYIANKNDLEQNDYIDLSELVMDDNYLGLSFSLNDSDYFNLNDGQEDNNIHFEKIIVYDENNNIFYCNNKELFDAFCNKNELNYINIVKRCFVQSKPKCILYQTQTFRPEACGSLCMVLCRLCDGWTRRPPWS